MYHKEMSPCVVKQQTLWPNNEDGQMLHTHLQQTNMQVRPHQQKPASQHQQYTTQASKEKVRVLTFNTECLPPYSLHRLQDTCHNAHIEDKKTAPTTAQANTHDPAPEHQAATNALEKLKQRAKRQTNRVTPAHRDEATEATGSQRTEAIKATRSLDQRTETPKNPRYLQIRDKNLLQRQETWREWTPETPRNTTPRHNRDKNLLHHIMQHRTKHIKSNLHQTDRKLQTTLPRNKRSHRYTEGVITTAKNPANRDRHSTKKCTRPSQQMEHARVPATRSSPPRKHRTDYSSPPPKVEIRTPPKTATVKNMQLQPKASTVKSLYRGKPLQKTKNPETSTWRSKPTTAAIRKTSRETNSAPKNEELRGRKDTRKETWPTAGREEIPNTYIGKTNRERSRLNNPNSDTSILPEQMDDRKHLSAPKHKYKGESHLPSLNHSLSVLPHLSLPHTLITLTVDLLPPLHSIRSIHLVLVKHQHQVVKQRQIDRYQQRRQVVRGQSSEQRVRLSRSREPIRSSNQRVSLGHRREPARSSEERVRLSHNREPARSSEHTRSRKSSRGEQAIRHEGATRCKQAERLGKAGRGVLQTEGREPQGAERAEKTSSPRGTQAQKESQ